MAQVTSGVYSFLSLPIFYSLFESLVGGLGARRKLIEECVKAQPGDRILDIGCGPGDVVKYLPTGVQYVGFDESATYIRAAQKRFGSRADFHCERVREKTLTDKGSFDAVFAFGVLHHLDDAEAAQLFRLSSCALKPGGRLFTLDGCFVPHQSRISRWLLSRDRGKNVRTKDGYMSLAASVFNDVRAHLRHDLFQVPYTALILECRRAPG